MVIEVPNGMNTSKMRVTEVLYSPEIGYTLISVGRLDKARFSLMFGQGECQISAPDGVKVGSVPQSAKGLYRVIHDSVESDLANPAIQTLAEMEFHRMAGHLSPRLTRELVSKGFVTGVQLAHSSDGKPFFCESCVYAKSKCQSVPKEHQGKQATEFSDVVYTDIWGPSRTETLNHRTYFITFTDDAKQSTQLYLIQKKSEAFTACKQYEAWCHTQHNKAVKCLHSDPGGGYLSDAFKSHLADNGMEHKLTVHNTPEENGVAERLNGILLEKVRAMLHDSGLPRFLWGEAISHAVWLKNQTWTKALVGKTPFKALTGMVPDLSNLHIWGCVCWVHQDPDIIRQSKLDSRAKEGQWVGFDPQSQGYQIYWPGEQKVTVEQSVTFTKPEVVQLEGEETKTDKFSTTSNKSPLTPSVKAEVSTPIIPLISPSSTPRLST